MKAAFYIYLGMMSLLLTLSCSINEELTIFVIPYSEILELAENDTAIGLEERLDTILVTYGNLWPMGAWDFGPWELNILHNGDTVLVNCRIEPANEKVSINMDSIWNGTSVRLIGKEYKEWKFPVSYENSLEYEYSVNDQPGRLFRYYGSTKPIRDTVLEGFMNLKRSKEDF